MKKILLAKSSRCFTIILLGIIFTTINANAAKYKYKGSLVKDSSTTDNSYISLDSDQPDYIVFMPGDIKIYLKGLKSSELHKDGTWDEEYNTNLKRVSITLKKDREKGLYEIYLNKRDNIIYFEPDKSDILAVTEIPSLFINNVMFANIDKKGKIIDNYGEEIEGYKVKFLVPKIVYQSLIPDSLVTLDIKLFYPNGKLMTNSYSPKGFSYSISFKTGDIVDEIEQNLGNWEAKFGKGYKLEIYNNTKLLASIDIPTRGVLTYIPIVARMDGGHSITLPHINKKQSVYRNLYKRGYTGPFEKTYIITGWRVKEE